MLKLLFPKCFLLALFLCWWTPKVSAQGQEVLLPPRLDYAPPPDLSTLPSPPELEWESLPERPPDEESSPAPPPPVSMAVPPQAETPLDPPSSTEIVPGATSLAPVEVSKSSVEVWREESESPQMPARQGPQFDRALVTGTEPVLVHLQFSALAAGKSVIVRPGPGVTVDPPETEFHVAANGECVGTSMSYS